MIGKALLLSLLTWLPPLLASPNEQGIEEVIVTAERLYRSRETLPAPTLIYEREFFQHFEPVAVGDMLKRVSGVSFSGDLGEFDAPQLRGLAAQYTQVLIDGRPIPGAADDRSVFVDRIPADLVERVEVIRSPGPDIDAQGIGGTLNIILRDGASFDGGAWHLGGHLQVDGDSRFRGRASISQGGSGERSDYFVSAHYQERLFPKIKTETVFDADGELVHTGFSDDRRDNTDLSLSARFGVDLDTDRRIDLTAEFIDTDIRERERIEVFDAEFELDEVHSDREDVDQQRALVAATYLQTIGAANLEIGLSLGRYEEQGQLKESVEQEQGLLPLLVQASTTNDDEVDLDASWAFQVGTGHDLEIGLAIGRRQRDATEVTAEDDEGELQDVSRANGDYRIEESRVDAYLKDEFRLNPVLTLQYGVRVENTRLDQRGSDGAASDSQLDWLPSAHLIYQPNPANQLRFSLARTLRRPSFDQLVPFTDLDTPSEGQSTIGNPMLEAEIASGLDLGYEYRFTGHQGIAGLNLFYRDIQDKIELIKISDDLFSPRNSGKGTTWGAEFDLSLPLDRLGWPNLGLYANYTWLDSEITDPHTGDRRRFNFQPDFIANLDLIHQLPSRGITWGASYQKQGSSRSRALDEFKTVSYRGNLGLFIEKTFTDKLLARLSVDNLLDAKKTETSVLFEGLDELVSGEVNEIVHETEQTGPVLLLTLSGQF